MPGPGFRHRLREAGKYVAYRTPGLDRLMRPSYPYKVEPAQLAALVRLVEDTRSSGAAVAEVGVAQGDTSVFLLQHLRITGDPRRAHLFDTFSGFTRTSIDVEVGERGKHAEDYELFRYGSAERFRRQLMKAGYDAFEVHAGDAAVFDWSRLGPIGAVLLDIDLYQPTIRILEAVYDHLVDGGGIVVDDCLDDTEWDGSLQAYTEFIEQRGLPFVRVGHKGALVRKG